MPDDPVVVFVARLCIGFCVYMYAKLTFLAAASASCRDLRRHQELQMFSLKYSRFHPLHPFNARASRSCVFIKA